MCYDEMGKLTYSMVGVAIEKQQDYEFISTYTFSLICNYEEEKLGEVVNLFDGEGQGALAVINFANKTQEDWEEALAKEVIKKNKRLNDAINEFYGREEEQLIYYEISFIKEPVTLLSASKSHMVVKYEDGSESILDRSFTKFEDWIIA